MASLILFASILCAVCNAQVQYGQTQYGGMYNQQQQQQYQYQQQYQQQLRQQQYQQQFRRVTPNQFINRRSGVETRRSGYDASRVRVKPNYGRVHPDQYANVLDRNQQHKKQFVQRVVYQKQPQYIQQPQPQPQQYVPQYNRNPYIYTTTKQSTGYNPNKRYMPTWPKLRGHCNKPPPFKIKGEDPIKKVCEKGHVTVVFLMKRRCDFCYHQLRELNKLAIHYRSAGKPMSVVVINHKRGPLSPTLIQKYPGLTFYEEPVGEDIFGKLGGAWRQIIVYDVCCRKQYLYGYPFSWMGYSFVRHAIFNTLYYDQVLCGVCKSPMKVNTTAAATTPMTLPTERVPGI